MCYRTIGNYFPLYIHVRTGWSDQREVYCLIHVLGHKNNTYDISICCLFIDVNSASKIIYNSVS